jgi:hypothetical protein
LTLLPAHLLLKPGRRFADALWGTPGLAAHYRTMNRFNKPAFILRPGERFAPGRDSAAGRLVSVSGCIGNLNHKGEQ